MRPPHLPGLVDTHCHLDYPPMDADLAGTLARAEAAGVGQVIHIGCSRARAERAVELAASHPAIFAAVGVHPHEADAVDEPTIEALAGLARAPRVVAIGESGLDYYYRRSAPEAQQRALALHRELARELRLPLVLHIRDAHADALAIMDAAPPLPCPGVIHCFTGGPADATAWLERGFFLSFSGIATFPGADPVRDAAHLCPAERLLVETDAPFLAPVPLRGRKNEPANVAFTCAHLARLRGEAPEALAARAGDNARTLFGLPDVRQVASAPPG